ncbi:MAG: type III-B CRISPR module RAMP protein Cmr6 [Magnetococcales bacterium]|nr:type III-B CRISPR module RAMP protein Cmr6 [Magnetococcales bacterium]
MTSPLYKGAMEAARKTFKLNSGNAGLWYDKFCDKWSDDFAELGDEGAKLGWVRSVTNAWTKRGYLGDARPVGDDAILGEYLRRRKSLVTGCRGHFFIFTAETRFVTGLGRSHPVENGLTWHPSLGVPYLPGSGVKGMVRAYVREWTDTDEARIAAIFGSEAGPQTTSPSVGSVIFLDALPQKPVQLVAEVMTPHYGPWYQQASPVPVPPADWYSPTPIPFLAVEAGTPFSFAIMPRPGHDTDGGLVAEWLKEALQWIGAGAKSATGMGRFKVMDATPPPPVQRYHDGRPIRIDSAEEDGLVEIAYMDEEGGEDVVSVEEIKPRLERCGKE